MLHTHIFKPVILLLEPTCECDIILKIRRLYNTIFDNKNIIITGIFDTNTSRFVEGILIDQSFFLDYYLN